MKGVNTEIQEPMHSSDSLKSDWHKTEDNTSPVDTLKDHDYGIGDTTYTRICLFEK